MRRFASVCLALTVTLTILPTVGYARSATPTPGTVWHRSKPSISWCMAVPTCYRPYADGHGGSFYTDPFNAMSSFENAYKEGADFIEADYNVSADQVGIVQHDDKLGGYFTCGTGYISQMTAAQLQKIALMDFWHVKCSTTQFIITWPQLLTWAKGKIMINFDYKMGDWHVAVNEVRAAKMMDQVLFEMPGSDYTAFRAYAPEAYMIAKAGSPTDVTNIIAMNDPKIVVIEASATWVTSTVLSLIHAAGKKITTDAWNTKSEYIQANCTNFFKAGWDFLGTDRVYSCTRQKQSYVQP